MANHCYNYIEFTGTSDRVNALQEGFVKLSKDSESKTFTEACDKSFGLESPPDADYVHYGTKWFDFLIELVSRGCWYEYVEGFEDTPMKYCSIVISGESAWSPPKELTKKLCEAYRVRARHEYDEPGNDFGGITTFDEKGDYDEEVYTYMEFKYRYYMDFWWDEMIHLIREENYKTFEEFFEDNDYADLDDLKEAWKIAHEKES